MITDLNEFYQKIETLKVIKTDSINWLTYYLDESTGEKWIEEHMFPEMQAGGPPQLRKLERFPWE